MTSPEPPTTGWLGESSLPWNILLVVSLDEVPPVAQLRRRLEALSTDQHWGAPPETAVSEGEVAPLLARLASVPNTGHPVSVGRTPSGLVIRAHHAYVDGLGLLALVGELTGVPARSSATGVGERPRRSTLTTLVSRLLEVALRPPAAVASSGGRPTDDDVFAVATVAGGRRTTDLAHAAVQAISAWNLAAGDGPHRVALAVGLSTTGGADPSVGDHSGFLRIPDAERLGRSDLETMVASAPLQVGGTARSGASRRVSGLIRWGTRTFSRRLGSTVLVSHLGRVEGGSVRDGAFYPVAGGGSGMSLGAVTISGRTTVTLRARGRQHDPVGLEQLLATIIARLAADPSTG